MKQIIDISTGTILRFLAVVLGLYLLFLIKDVLLMIFVAMIIAAAVDGPVDWLAKHRVRRSIGTAIIYIAVFFLLALSIYLVFPVLGSQLKTLALSYPDYISRLGAELNIAQEKIGADTLQNLLNNLSGQLTGAAGNVFGTAVNIFGGIFSFLVVLVISIYLVVQDKGIKNLIESVTPDDNKPYVLNLVERIQGKLGAWLRGQLLLMLIIGILVFIGLALLNIKFALTLALIAALLEIVPYIGPILGAAPAVVFAFAQSPFLALVVIALFIFIHQLENYLITPVVMKKTVGLNPLVVIISIIIGGKLAGMLGVIIAVPLVAALSVFLKDYWASRRR